ncbi:dihydroxy-acid dehydratase [Pendulispora brunnea]|uniref:Dihydroxy-acid dehydratase n=1 Tax=Pendulispora brunnea TaxID=2905690 RepID=A0ABZ2KSR9_9BACT
MRGSRYTDEDQEKPQAGTAYTWTEAKPCNAHQRRFAEKVNQGVYAAGGTPVAFKAPGFMSQRSGVRRLTKWMLDASTGRTQREEPDLYREVPKNAAMRRIDVQGIRTRSPRCSRGVVAQSAARVSSVSEGAVTPPSQDQGMQKGKGAGES